MNEENYSKFETKKWNIFNDNSKVNYDTANKITYNTEVLKCYLFYYNNAYIAYILVSGDITIDIEKRK